MVWDPDDHLIMMFGGRYGTTRYDSIVVYNPANTTVSGIPGRTMRFLASANLGCPSTGQSNCYFPAFTYDTTRHIGVLYAGPGQLLKYTYASNGGTWANTGVSGGPPARDSNSQLFPALSYSPELDLYLYASAVTAPSRTDTWQLPGASISGATTYTYSITVAGTGSGSVSDGAGFTCSSGTCLHNYAADATPTFTATPSGGGSFAGWSAGSGDLSACSGTGTCSGTVSQTSGVTATFNPPATTSTAFSGVTLGGVSVQ